MRVVIDLDTDGAGRPMGIVRADTCPHERFSDWLDLLRVLETCVRRVQDTSHAEGASCEQR